MEGHARFPPWVAPWPRAPCALDFLSPFDRTRQCFAVPASGIARGPPLRAPPPCFRASGSASPPPCATCPRPPALAADGSASAACSVFVVSEVLKASGGRAGCFLYRGKLVTPPPRSRTPDRSSAPQPRGPSHPPPASRTLLGGGAATCGACPLETLLSAMPHGEGGGDEGEEEEQLDLSELEGSELTLYMRWAQPSPARRAAGQPASQCSPPCSCLPACLPARLLAC